jgi:hypothetical protein
LHGAKSISKELVPGRVNEAHCIRVEGTVDRVQHGEFSESLDGEEQHGTDDHEAQKLSGTSQRSVTETASSSTLLTTLAGPPLLKALPEPTNRPAPIEPPVEKMDISEQSIAE